MHLVLLSKLESIVLLKKKKMSVKPLQTPILGVIKIDLQTIQVKKGSPADERKTFFSTIVFFFFSPPIDFVFKNLYVHAPICSYSSPKFSNKFTDQKRKYSRANLENEWNFRYD